MSYINLSFPENTCFLITGAAGFIGSNLVETILSMGYRVKALDNLSTGKEENVIKYSNNPLFDFIEGDICDFEICTFACESVDYVLHQAAWGSVPRSIEMPLYYEKINIQGTLNMMEASKQKNVKRFVYASSSSVYGDSNTLPKIEGEEGNVISPYALTKKVNEEYGRLYTKLYGLETIGLRYFNVFGKYQDPHGYYAAVIPKFIKSLLSFQPATIYGDGKQSRDFTYIDNVIEANLKACIASEEAVGDVYNIAYGSQKSLNDIYYKICELLNIYIDPIFDQERKGDIKHSNADISKASKYLNYDPSYDFNKGIEISLEWYKNNLVSVS